MKNQGRLGRFGHAAVAVATAAAGVLAVSPAPASAAPPVVVTLTFDDGLTTQFQLRNILARHRVKATFYLNTGLIPANPAGRMTWANARTLADAGHEIGGHTLTHANLASATKPDGTPFTDAEKQAEVCNDRANLVAQGFAATSFAYPEGGNDAAVRTLVQSCGYSNARLAGGLMPTGPFYGDGVPPADGAYGIRVLGAPNNGPVTLQWMQSAVTAATNNPGGGWVPMLFHRVCYPGTTEYTACMGTYRPVSAAVIDQFLTWAGRQGGISTATVTGMLNGQTTPLPSEPAPTPTPVVKAPDIRSLSRYTVPRGRVTPVVVRGANFRKATRVRITGKGIRIKSLTYIGPRKIRVAVKVTRGAPRTARTVIVVDRVTLKRDKLPRSLKVR
jgi:peptidoglycan/xylan/chitin deacetylase (PgdA/CDA1 family)